MKRKSVSVVIPVRNERKYFAACLDALLAQNYPSQEIEIICVDGMSNDGTRELILEYAARFNNIRLLDNSAKIVPPAMNIGIRAAQHDIIVRIDARCIVEPDYVRQCVHYLEKTGADNVGGPQIAVGENDPIAQAIAIVTTSPFGIGNSKFRYSKQEQYVDTVYLGAFPREVFERIGLYNEFLLRNQDFELNHRIRKAGGRIFFTPEIRSVYYGRNSIASLWRQYFQYGYWKVRTLQLHPESLKWRQLVAPGFVGVFILMLILFAFQVSSWSFPFLVAIYGIGLIAAMLHIHWSKLAKPNLWLFVIFPVVHFSWGAGFLWGLATLLFPPQRVPGSGY